MTSVWSPRHVALIGDSRRAEAPPIAAKDVRPVLQDLDLWDMWPLALVDGTTANVLGGELWMMLSAPKFANPDDRHDWARIRLLYQKDGEWSDRGPLLPEGMSPGTRQWSGSAILNPADGAVTLFFTAAGRAGEPERRFEQRLFQTVGRLEFTKEGPAITGWSAPVESVASDGDIYVRTELAPAAPGMIKGFRDPGYFRDPRGEREHLLFAGSLNGSANPYNGVIGMAQSRGSAGWSLLPPLISADGLCNELERPHLIYAREAYYVFWSSQASVFDPRGPIGPTGLYGMVAPNLDGPYQPLNQSGLVIANPATAPAQAYCWWVTNDLRVHSFIDRWIEGPAAPALPADRSLRPFGGTLAPVLRLELDGDRAVLAH